MTPQNGPLRCSKGRMSPGVSAGCPQGCPLGSPPGGVSLGSRRVSLGDAWGLLGGCRGVPLGWKDNYGLFLAEKLNNLLVICRHPAFDLVLVSISLHTGRYKKMIATRTPTEKFMIPIPMCIIFRPGRSSVTPGSVPYKKRRNDDFQVDNPPGGIVCGIPCEIPMGIPLGDPLEDPPGGSPWGGRSPGESPWGFPWEPPQKKP